METTVAIPILILINLGLGLLAGFIMHRSDFCMAGMFRDFFIFRQTYMLKILMLLVVSSMLIFELARRSGLLPIYPFPVLGSPSLANLIGGFLFGTGMVMAGGCVVGTLYRLGSGSVLSFVAFVGLIAGSGLYAEIHPFWKAFMTRTTYFQGNITIPQVLGLDPGLPVLAISLIASCIFYRWLKGGPANRVSTVSGYIQPWRAAIYLALLGGLSYIFVGMPFGITTAYAKVAAYIELLFAREHVTSLAFFNTIPLKYTVPLTQTYLEGGAGPRFDAISVIQFPLIIGIIAGSTISASLLGEFKLYFNVPVKQYASSLIGGIILGLAARMAPSCNVWHLMGGLPILAMQSILFLIGLGPGAWLGSQIIRRVVSNKP